MIQALCYLVFCQLGICNSDWWERVQSNVCEANPGQVVLSSVGKQTEQVMTSKTVRNPPPSLYHLQHPASYTDFLQ